MAQYNLPPRAVQNTFLLSPVVDGLTALAGGGQTGATLLTGVVNRVTTVATAADSLMLPVSVPGLRITVVNAAASNSMTVYPQVGDAINALSANAGLACAANKVIDYICTAAGQWHTNLTA